MDTQRAFGWYGGLLNASGLEIYGGNLSEHTLQTLQTASGIEADPTVRLWELWYQQKLLDDKVDVKVGQQSLDQEFMVTQNGSYFVNTMFGWPMLPSADLPGGGPAYPLSALGVRVRAHVTDSVTVLAGVYNGSPVTSIFGDPQKNQRPRRQLPDRTRRAGDRGIAIRLPLAEHDRATRRRGSARARLQDRLLVRQLAIRKPAMGERRHLLANPASSGIPQVLYGDYSFYAVADQMIYRFPDDADRNINVFVRPMFTPIQDRNLINFSLNAGVTMHEPIFGRDDDTFGLGMGYTHVSTGQQAFNRETAYYNPGTYVPVRSNETFIEATYQYQANAWLQIQPDLQYVIYPGAGLANPNNPTKRIGNELVVRLARQRAALKSPAREADHGEGKGEQRRTAMSRLRDVSAVLAAAAILTLGAGWREATPRAPCSNFHRLSTIASTVPDNGDLNPYALFVAPVSSGMIKKGDVIVDNFNNVSNLQGTGGTIIVVDPATRATRLFAKLPQNLPQCPGGVGLTTAMAMLSSGWVIVGSTPSIDGTTATKGPGCLLVFDTNGKLVTVWSGAQINDPWGNMAVVDNGDKATLFVSMSGFDLPGPDKRDPATGEWSSCARRRFCASNCRSRPARRRR